MPPVLLLLIWTPGECFFSFCGFSQGSCNNAAKGMTFYLRDFMMTTGHLNVVDQRWVIRATRMPMKLVRDYTIVEIGGHFFPPEWPGRSGINFALRRTSADALNSRNVKYAWLANHVLCAGVLWSSHLWLLTCTFLLPFFTLTWSVCHNLFSDFFFSSSAGFLSFLLSEPVVYADINPSVLNGPRAQSCLQTRRSVEVS